MNAKEEYWYRFDADKGPILRVLQTNVSMEDAQDDMSPRETRNVVGRCCSWCSKRQPTLQEPYNWTSLQNPRRLTWRWTPEGRPVCMEREDLWKPEIYERVLEQARELGTSREPSGREGIEYALGNRRRCCLCFRRSKLFETVIDIKLEAAAALPEQLGPIAAIMPVRDLADVSLVLESTSLEQAASTCDPATNGNLMWLAAQAGDTKLCSHLIETGHSSLTAMTSFSGRTAFEIALESGFPDTAFLLFPYARIRHAEKRRMLMSHLRQELEYIIKQAPPIDSRAGEQIEPLRHASPTREENSSDNIKQAKQTKTSKPRENQYDPDSAQNARVRGMTSIDDSATRVVPCTKGHKDNSILNQGPSLIEQPSTSPPILKPCSMLWGTTTLLSPQRSSSSLRLAYSKHCNCCSY